ncbi:MAG: hypothetical protein KIT08_06395 [Anaerolineales bacterium]|nr:MAG: hypothetical protein KIT08_06395 [Anaerolineales bacterium]
MAKPIAFATDTEWPQLIPSDQLAQAALTELGAAVAPVIWDADVDWAQYRAVVIRSTWDYHIRAAEFTAWLNALERAGVPVLNPLPVIRWNMHKRYLAELEADGIRIVPSLWLAQGQPQPYAAVQQRGWTQAALKPLVSADSYHTYVIEDEAEWNTHQPEVLALGDAVVQEFMPEVQSVGEYSLLFFGDQYSHAVLKTPKSGDFRTQMGYGASTEAVEASPELIAQAARVLETVSNLLGAQTQHRPLAYARVDGILREDAFYLMELELIEPNLFLDYSPGAAQHFARTLLAQLEN